MTSVARLTTISTQHARMQTGLVSTLLKQLLGAWAGFDSWHDPDLVAGRAAASANLVDLALPNTRRQSQSYMRATLRDMSAAPRQMPAVQDLYPRANITPFEVYKRPATQYVYSASRGMSAYEAAVDARRRLATLSETDLRAADRDEATKVMAASSKVIGYRRVIHPEESPTGSCGLCVAASTRIYHVEDLQPMHFPTCKCLPLPLLSGQDPAEQINDDFLRKLYGAAGGTDAEALRQTRIQVGDHGELGPVLVKEGDRFTTAKDLHLPAYVRPDPEAAAQMRRLELEQVTAAQQSASARFDEFMTAHPQESWSGSDRQDAYNLQRAALDLAARIRNLSART